MKTLTLFLALTLAGCATLTPREKTFLKVTGTIVVVGLIAAHQADTHEDRRSIDPPRCETGSCQ